MYIGNLKTRGGMAPSRPILTIYKNPGSTSGRTAMRQGGYAEVFRNCPDGYYDAFEDFDEDTGITGEPETVYTIGAGAATITAGGRCGILGMTTTNGNNHQAAGWYRNNYQTVDAQYGGRCAFRFQLTADIAANQRMVFGFCSTLAFPLTSMTRFAYVLLSASNAVTLSAYDGTTTTTGKATSSTLVSGSTLANFYTIGLYFDGNNNAQFLISDDRGANTAPLGSVPYVPDTTILQPFFVIEKDSGTGVMGANIDFARWGCRRV